MFRETPPLISTWWSCRPVSKPVARQQLPQIPTWIFLLPLDSPSPRLLSRSQAPLFSLLDSPWKPRNDNGLNSSEWNITTQLDVPSHWHKRETKGTRYNKCYIAALKWLNQQGLTARQTVLPLVKGSVLRGNLLRYPQTQSKSTQWMQCLVCQL